jgi:hypothetical protein
MNNSKTDLFSTHDMPMAATMVALGHTIERIDRETSGRAKFHFRRSEKLQGDVTAFWQQELRISPKLLFEGLKFVKSLLYSGMAQ